MGLSGQWFAYEMTLRGRHFCWRLGSVIKGKTVAKPRSAAFSEALVLLGCRKSLKKAGDALALTLATVGAPERAAQGGHP